MNKYFLVLLVSLVFLGSAIGQTKGLVKGRLIDTSGVQSINRANISVLDPSDSSVEFSVLSKSDGSFEVGNLRFDSYLLRVSFEGYTTLFKKFSIANASPETNLGNIVMKVKTTDLQEVIIEQKEMTIKKDTVEFNASSFKTKPNAVAEDLLKKLPGVEVASDGTVKAQGEQVTRILVDGKRFFGDDPKMATKNLPPDIIDKIQIFDDLSDQAKFTGFDDGSRIKTINITTKKDKRKGYFGKAVLGAGTDETYDESVNMHRFNGTQQLSLLGQGNDVNKQNFTQQDILGTSGGRGGRGGGSTGSGITTTWAGGANMRDSIGHKAEGYGSYFYNNQNTNTLTQSNTQSILSQDSSTFNAQRQQKKYTNENHRINLNIEANFDTMNALIFRPNVSFQSTHSNSDQTTGYTGGIHKTPIYNSLSNSNQKNTGYSGQSDLTYRHKFQKRFRTTSLGLNVQASNNDGNGKNLSANNSFTPTYTDTINQQNITNSTGFSISPTFSYTEPLASNQIIEFNYNYSYSRNTSEKFTYDYVSLTKSYSRFDSLFSNRFENTYHSNRFTLSYRLQNKNYNFNIGSGIQSGEVNSINTTKNSVVNQHYVNLTPTANFIYNFSRTNNLRFYYSGRTGQPGVSQLQPVITTSDSINFSRGNADLKQQFTHSLRVLYSNFDVVTQRVMFATINASTIQNDIQNSVTYLRGPRDRKGAQLTVPVNLNGTYNLSGYFNYGFALKHPKSNLNLISNASYSQSQTLINNLSNYTRNTTLSQSISWTTNLKDNFDVNLKVGGNYNIARYTLQPTQNANYYSGNASVEFTYFNKRGWIFATNFDYTYNGNHAAGYNSSIPLLTPYIAKQFLKNNAGEFRFTVFDLLNQNTSISRTTSGNTIQDTRTNTLTRYGILTFTYNLRNFGNQRGKMPSFMRGAYRNFREMGGGGDMRHFKE